MYLILNLACFSQSFGRHLPKLLGVLAGQAPNPSRTVYFYSPHLPPGTKQSTQFPTPGLCWDTLRGGCPGGWSQQELNHACIMSNITVITLNQKYVYASTPRPRERFENANKAIQLVFSIYGNHQPRCNILLKVTIYKCIECWLTHAHRIPL